MATASKDLDLSQLDSPEKAEDVLQRDHLAWLLSQGLTKSRASESLVTAIYGPWGSGKTWLKHRLLNYLRQSITGRFTVIEFNPWQIRGVDELLIQFFSQIFDRLEDGAEKATKANLAKRKLWWGKLAKFSVGASLLKTVGGIAGLEPILAASLLALSNALSISKEFADLFKGDDKDKTSGQSKPMGVDGIRKELAELFGKEGMPKVIVVIDDVDRMAADEIQTLIRVIKANANFAGLDYLILCDPEQVAAALDPIASGKGSAYLEKIVQNPIRLPEPGPDAIFNQLFHGLASIATRGGYLLEKEKPRLRGYFENFLSSRLRNLRSVYRLLEAVDFSASVLTKDDRLEVDLLDLLAVDFLRLHCPSLMVWIQSMGPSFDSLSLRLYGKRIGLEKAEKTPLSEVLPANIADEFGVGNAFHLLTSLFPRLEESITCGAFVGSSRTWRNRDARKMHLMALADDEHFESYFQLLPLPTKVPAAEYEESVGENCGRSRLLNFVQNWNEKGQLASAMERLRTEMGKIPFNQRKSLVMAMVRSADGIKPSEPSVWQSDISKCMGIMCEFLAAEGGKNHSEAICEVFDQENALLPKLFLLEELRIILAPDDLKHLKCPFNLPKLSGTKLGALQRKIAREAEVAILERKFFTREDGTFRVWRWRHALGCKFTQKFIVSQLDLGNLAPIYEILLLVARSVAASRDCCFWIASTFKFAKTFSLGNDLEGFAPLHVWKKFASKAKREFPPTETPQDGYDCLVQFVRLWTNGKLQAKVAND